MAAMAAVDGRSPQPQLTDISVSLAQNLCNGYLLSRHTQRVVCTARNRSSKA